MQSEEWKDPKDQHITNQDDSVTNKDDKTVPEKGEQEQSKESMATIASGDDNAEWYETSEESANKGWFPAG